jgi:formylglycine-generating enzyme required for sulfatase activity
VQAAQSGKNITVTYDLSGGQNSDEFEVSLYCSENGGSTFSGPLASVNGDIGAGIKSGYGKQITWNVLAEREKLSGSRIVFEVRANNTNTAGIEMVFVKGGTFTMGCTSEQTDCGDDEKPAHQVMVSDFYMGKYEVTQKQWREIIGSNPSYFNNCDNCPVENVSWNDVQEFIIKLNQKTGKNYRLPTEAEWEYAARGGSAGSPTRYAGSNTINEVAWYADNSGQKTHPVGQKKANELGIYDMTGNVWEWCNDWYGSDYYSSSPQYDPKGPVTGSRRVIRGGSWFIYPQGCRVSNRISNDPDDGYDYGGFRLVHSL